MYEHNIADKLTTFVNEVYNSIANQASDRVLFEKKYGNQNKNQRWRKISGIVAMPSLIKQSKRKSTKS